LRAGNAGLFILSQTNKETKMKKLIHKPTALAFALALVLASEATASAQLRYVASEGGWVDKKNNLVWGYDPNYITTALPPGVNGDGFPTPEEVDYATAEFQAENYPSFLASYGWHDLATVAAYWENRGLVWRLPTLNEVERAFKQGLFSEPLYASELGIVRWTSTSSTADPSENYVFDDHSNYVELLGTSLPFGTPLFVRAYR
jgi:hypothetical protein